MRSNPISLFANLLRDKFWPYVTIEPAYFLAYLAAEMMDFLNPILYLQKACRGGGGGDLLTEPDLSTQCDDEKAGVQFVTDVYATSVMASACVSLIATMFMTSYSDLAGRKRKPFITLSLIGLLLQAASATAQAFFWRWPPLLGVLLNALLPDLLGGNAAVMVFCILLVYDKTRLEDRHIAITSVVCLKLIGKLIGKGVAGHLLRAFGFVYSFAACCLLYLLSLGCVFALVHDKRETVQNKVTWLQIFSLKRIYESLKKILFSKKYLKHRIAIWLLAFLSTLVYFTVVGEQSVFYLYFRYRFQWDERRFSNYSAYRVLTGMTGGMLCTLIMSKVLKIHDSIIGTFAALMDTLAAIGFFFAVTDWQIYAVPLLDIFHGVAMSTCYSLISKFFTDQEFGRLHSVHMLFNLATAFSLPAYSLLFKSTMDTFPNAFFLLSIFLNAVICITYSIVYFLSKDIR